MAMEWQTIQIPLAAGLNQKLDDRVLTPPSLAAAIDVQFDDVGALQTRYPFAQIGDTFASDDIRRVYANGDELLVFTKTNLYSYDSVASAWIDRGTHLAVKSTETTRFDSPSDQTHCDRAELDGVVVYAWYDTAATAVSSVTVDKATGAVLSGPTSYANTARPRLLAMASGSRIQLYFHDTSGNNLVVRSMTPTSGTYSFSSQQTVVSSATGFNSYYDVSKIPNANTAIVACRLNPTTSYHVVVINFTGSPGGDVTPARTCDGPIAVSVAPNSTQIQIVRGNGTNIQGDRLDYPNLDDEAVNQAVGTGTGTINQIGIAHRDTTDGGQYRCYAFWSSSESAVTLDWDCDSNYVDTGGGLGTAARFKYQMGVASKPFCYNGSIYFWGVFAIPSSFSGTGVSPLFRASLQNTYFLYRDDGFLCAKASANVAGGHSPSTGWLPSVGLTSGTTTFSWCGTERRVIDLGGVNQTGYGARAPRDIVFTFDSNEARRVARLGNTLYVTGGEVLQYDGEKLTEVGFHIFPYYFEAIDAAGGSVGSGDYGLKPGWRWDNAAGEQERSAAAVAGTVSISSGRIAWNNGGLRHLHHTHKTGIAIEGWRTPVDPSSDSPFYLVTSKDPAVTSNPNRYLTNDATTAGAALLNDDLADATLTTKEYHPDNGGVLEALAPPAATIIAADDTRLFLAGIADNPHRIWYSKLRGDGQVAAFNDVLTVDVPPSGGVITALAFLNETLIVFKETSIYALSGLGYDNIGGGQNYGPPRILASDVGAVSAESVVLTADGLIFKSNKGWYLLNRGWSASYIGAPISDYDSDTVVAVHALDHKHQVRCLTTSRLLVFDTLVNQWAEWSVSNGLHATIFGGEYYYVSEDTVLVEETTYTALDYGIDVETPWIKLADLQGTGRVRALQLLGEYRSTHHLRVRVAYDYDTTWIDDKYWEPSPTTVGGPLQFRHGPARQSVQAIKFRFTAVSATSHLAAPAGEALKLVGLGLEVGTKRGLWRRLPAAQRQ